MVRLFLMFSSLNGDSRSLDKNPPFFSAYLKLPESDSRQKEERKDFKGERKREEESRSIRQKEPLLTWRENGGVEGAESGVVLILSQDL